MMLAKTDNHLTTGLHPPCPQRRCLRPWAQSTEVAPPEQFRDADYWSSPGLVHPGVSPSGNL